MDNGRLPDSILKDAGPPAGSRLRAGAADSWAQVRARVLRDYGWLPMPTSAADCYRPYHIQERIFRARYTTSYVTGIDPRWWNGQQWWRLRGVASAATPGRSNHGWGLAVDVTGLGGFKGLRFIQFGIVARSLGWSNREGASIGEAWHWVYEGPADTVSNPGGGTSVPTLPDEIDTPDLGSLTPIDVQEDTMFRLRYGSQVYLVSALSFVRMVDSETNESVPEDVWGGKEVVLATATLVAAGGAAADVAKRQLQLTRTQIARNIERSTGKATSVHADGSLTVA